MQHGVIHNDASTYARKESFSLNKTRNPHETLETDRTALHVLRKLGFRGTPVEGH